MSLLKSTDKFIFSSFSEIAQYKISHQKRVKLFSTYYLIQLTSFNIVPIYLRSTYMYYIFILYRIKIRVFNKILEMYVHNKTQKELYFNFFTHLLNSLNFHNMIDLRTVLYGNRRILGNNLANKTPNEAIYLKSDEPTYIFNTI